MFTFKDLTNLGGSHTLFEAYMGYIFAIAARVGLFCSVDAVPRRRRMTERTCVTRRA